MKINISKGKIDILYTERMVDLSSVKSHFNFYEEKNHIFLISNEHTKCTQQQFQIVGSRWDFSSIVRG